MKKGIDVSHHNGEPNTNPIDWQKVGSAATPNGPVRFTFIKATEGVTFDDVAAESNAQGAGDVGIDFGYYHFAQPASNAAAAEADHFFDRVSTLPPPTFSYPYALDLETNGDEEERGGLSRADYLTWVENFMTRFLGHFPVAPVIIIYGAPDFFDRNLPPDHTLGQRFPLWIAHVDVPAPRLPKGWDDWAIWQYSWNERIAGIAAPTVDADLAKI